MKYLKINILIVFVFAASLSYSQYIKVENGRFKVVNYTLIDDVLLFRAYDCDSRKCILGGEMDAIDFYEWNFLTNRKGMYEIVIYLKPDRILIREFVVVK
ncbi:MAG: hypothetical protein ABI543_11600 [Ignavibacteria bacterium]